jgi:hypothetical protein
MYNLNNILYIIPGQVKPKIIKLLFDVSPLNKQQRRVGSHECITFYNILYIIPGRVKPKIIKLLFVVSPLSTQERRVGSLSG